MMESQVSGAASDRVSGVHWWKTPAIPALAILVVLAWTPWLFKTITTTPTIELSNYGLHGNFTFIVTCDTSSLKKYSNTHKLLLLVRFEYANIDRMSDTDIEKSAPYTIDGRVMTIAVIGKLNPPNLRVDNTQPNVLIEYNLALVPALISPSTITGLADVERVGGIILATRAQLVPFGSLGITVVPESK